MIFRHKKTKEKILRMGTATHEETGEKYVTFKKLDSKDSKNEFIIYTMKQRKLALDYEPD